MRQETVRRRCLSGTRERGMTLVEVLAVVVILGLIAGTLAVSFSGAFSKGKHELAKAGIGLIVQRIEAYRIEHDAWPDEAMGLASLSDGHAEPIDPYYLKPDQLLDPWNNRFLLIVPGPSGHPYEVLSYGADGQPGGDGPDSDLSSVDLRSEK